MSALTLNLFYRHPGLIILVTENESKCNFFRVDDRGFSFKEGLNKSRLLLVGRYSQKAAF